jgi:hypothetical protein
LLQRGVRNELLIDAAPFCGVVALAYGEARWRTIGRTSRDNIENSSLSAAWSRI